MAESVALKGLPKEEKRELLLSQSLSTMAAYGYNSITLDLIAEKVGVSKGTLSYYFKNKENLLLEAIQYAGMGIIDDFKKTVADYDTPAEKIKAGLQMLWVTFSTNPNVIKVYYDMYAQALYAEQFGAVMKEINDKFRSIFYDLLIESNEMASLEAEKPEDVVVKAAMLSCVIDGIVKQMVVDPEYFSKFDMNAGVGYLIDKICERIES